MRIRLSAIAAGICALLLAMGCNNLGFGAAVAMAKGGAEAVAPQDFKPTMAVFIPARTRSPAKMAISYIRNLPSGTSFSQIWFKFYANDLKGRLVYYGDLTVKCPDSKQPACSEKTFTVPIYAARVCRTADASAPGQIFACDLAPAHETQMHVYPVHVIIRESDGRMTRKLSVTESQNLSQFRGTFSRRKPSVASANWVQLP